MKSLKLNCLEKNNLSNKEMSAIIGGNTCGCGCHGSSSIEANAEANYQLGISSKGEWQLIRADLEPAIITV
ncbi:MAG: TIGR04149 family rSAM-modified RiPP [Bacteroidales bacterium]|jgi:natural product precursor|nr:TIGR04149 family rSAM-modified RiPP [Bacteroidales bacterium]MCI2146345.1 TIGR04149 family rSAM-modified RiPP [Bacteroidales bacterium]